ncbi:pyridoxamine 5'-phosphate oxidase family protein [Paenibacillus albus]|uniref:Pyridoxamine 5'-phosphate oxidase family protein n=1 Tax=Paenibacillus albus TaxID=2495582 RepID=A0A3S9A5L8_9BACL|nr:pyridoxamine 5'-phosphate oxidase family protein [Paenibacillus albus]AZN40976.1 pyridoxamine 5'-phosphate oxidase family protein [Paenibacillus albus]
MLKPFFNDIVHTEEELRSMLGHPSELVRNKVVTRLDRHCKAFIAEVPIVFVATSNASGACDVSPRGDAAGFVAVLDETHLLIPERPGNKRMDTLRNIIENPHIGLIFVIPGLEETLRINGRACIIKDQERLQLMEVRGKAPLLGIGVEMEEGFIHCAKAFKRSKLWEPASWPQQDAHPNPARILADHASKLGKTEEEIASALRDSYEKRLY